MPRPIPLSREVLLGVAAAAVMLLAIGCSSSGKTSNPTTATSPAAAGGVSGNWTGTYDGSFSGTFSLSWTQAGSNLTGTIMISGFGNAPTSISGTLQGNSIHFGSVGGQVQYTGTLSGSSMSGTWTLAGNAGHGSWKASKTS